GRSLPGRAAVPAPRLPGRAGFLGIGGGAAEGDDPPVRYARGVRGQAQGRGGGGANDRLHPGDPAVGADRVRQRPAVRGHAVTGAARWAPGTTRSYYSPSWRLTACGPLPRGSGWVSNVTLVPSSSGGRPERSIAFMWTKTSLPPSSGVIKPKPRAWLKNLMTPFCRMEQAPFVRCTGTREDATSRAGRRVSIVGNRKVKRLTALWG